MANEFNEEQFAKDAIKMTVNELAAKYGIHRNTARNRKNKLGLSKHTLVDSEEFKKDVESGMRLKDLSIKYNMDSGSITLRVHEAGLRLKQWRYDKNGYIKVYCSAHPKADMSGYVLEHRLAMEQYLGRYLTDDEIVHHVDGNKNNNDISNLQVMTRAEHMRLHDNCLSDIQKLRKKFRKNGTRNN